MSGHGNVTFDWGDGTYTFRLGLKEVRELQENPRINLGPLALFRRIENDQWLIDDLREVIRLGLIGGGVKPDKATKLIYRYFDDFPPIDHKIPAMTILSAFLIGDPADPVGKTTAAEDANGSKKVTDSPLPQ